jgi:hypothetical protein
VSALQTQKPVGMASSELCAMIVKASRLAGVGFFAGGAVSAIAVAGSALVGSTFFRLTLGMVLDP